MGVPKRAISERFVSEWTEVDGSSTIEVSVVLPCLNEAETIAACIDKCFQAFQECGVTGEVVVADNGSTDGSQLIAVGHNARLINISVQGYGSALRGGMAASRGAYILMADADDTYELDRLGPFIDSLVEGNDLVVGNRFEGGIEPGAMPFLHRYLGNPVLSGIGRLLFRSPCRDFHCGLRGLRRETLERLDLRSVGMEFASEMILKASLNGLRIAEVPTTLVPSGRTRPPHLRSWRDGWRHLRLMVLYSPSWLFIYPGLMLLLVSFAVVIESYPTGLGESTGAPGINRSILVGLLVGAGVRCLTSGLIAMRCAATGRRALVGPHSPKPGRLGPMELGLVVGGTLTSLSILGLAWSFIHSTGRMSPVPASWMSMIPIVMSIVGIALGFETTLLGSLYSTIDLHCSAGRALDDRGHLHGNMPAELPEEVS